MSNRRTPPDRRVTKPLPREQLAPISSPSLSAEDQNAVETLVPCPVCLGNRLVSPDVAGRVNELMTKAADEA